VSASPKTKLTKTTVEALPTPATGHAALIYRDSALPGFGVRVTSNGVRTYVVEKRLRGRSRRISLGRHGVLTVDQARREAQLKLADITVGKDPVAERRAQRMLNVTLEGAGEAYLTARKDLKPRSVADYRRHLEKSFGEWRTTPLAAITRDMVSKKHSSLGEASPAQADQAMRFLRAVFNYAQESHTDDKGRSLLHDNPVRVLTKTRAWYPKRRRKTFIRAEQMPAFYAALVGMTSKTKPEATALARDYVLFLLFTGCRREEAVRLLWEDVDLQRRTFTLRDTKNGSDATLPLPEPLVTMLEARQSLDREVKSAYVFSKSKNVDHMRIPSKHIERLIKDSGVQFSLHDLRRTFATVAESLDISDNTIKRLLNHVTDSDVTAGYIVRDIERLRAASDKIAQRILELGTQREVALSEAA
jgi:integrase